MLAVDEYMSNQPTVNARGWTPEQTAELRRMFQHFLLLHDELETSRLDVNAAVIRFDKSATAIRLKVRNMKDV